MTKILVVLLASVYVASGMSDAEVERLADAIYYAEGGKKAKVSYGILSVKTRSEAHARAICLNSVRNAWGRWKAAGSPGDFIEHMGRRYAPIGAANDSKGLNKHWVRNVKYRYDHPL